MSERHFMTRGGVAVTRREEEAEFGSASAALVDRLDSQRGALFASNYEYPGRYNRWEFGFVQPPLMIEGRGREMHIQALNPRGEVLAKMLRPVVEALDAVATAEMAGDGLRLTIRPPERVYDEEDRSRAPSFFSVLRAISEHFHTEEDAHLGLYGAFGYDLAFQFEPIALHLDRPADQRDLVLFLIDELLVTDHYSTRSMRIRWDFASGDLSTAGLPGGGSAEPFAPGPEDVPRGDHEPGEYAALVREAKTSFRRGDLFEVVPGQVFYESCRDTPAAIHRRLKAMNPAPFGFVMNLGRQEYLVGASPEMFVRVTGRRVETCPISGTIKRGVDAIEDSEQILKLLQSKKDESELTMCSDVDRNDKSRVCEPGSVRIIGRRQIEMYSRLIHTVDHIEGRLRAGMDAYDAFLSHAWAVTVTGAPKLWAMRFIEAHEKSTRFWYGGAVGAVGFNGDMNTGLTLRTIRIKDGVAEIRAGATLLDDSDPDEEEAETELKASAMRAACAVRACRPTRRAAMAGACPSRRAAGFCLSITRTVSCTRWPITCARQGPWCARCARRSPTRCSRTSRPILSACRPGRAGLRISRARRRSRRRLAGGFRSSGSALACRRSRSITAARSTPWQRPCTASPPASRSPGPARSSPACPTG